MGERIVRAAAGGTLAAATLLSVYFGSLTLVSNWAFTLSEFSAFWPFIIALVTGFGVQVALFLYLRGVVRGRGNAGVVAASGTTSATAMVSCCAHYLVTLAPVIGATGLVTLVAQYQVELFWAGLAFNAAGIIYIWRQLAVAVKEQTQCVSPA